MTWIAGSHPLGDAKWIPGSKPGDDERKKEPGNDKGKGRQYRKEFLLTIPGRMLFGKKKRATRKPWHNDDNRSGQARLLGEEADEKL